MGARQPLVGGLSVRPHLVAVTGATGRLGGPVMGELASLGIPAVAWSRPDYDLDDPAAAEHLVRRDAPTLIIHAAGWVDVDGCAREPELAMRRNATAVSELATAAGAAGVDLILISTNEVFDGARTDKRGYSELDQPSPVNSYGASKLAGERAATEAMSQTGARLWIIRTSWLYGPAGNDFPSKIIAAVDRGVEPIRVVDDEFGCPTSTAALARLLPQVLALRPGTYHMAGSDVASRYEWATEVLRHERPGVHALPVSSGEFQRTSTPPRWGVLDSTIAATAGLAVPSWRGSAGS